MELINKQVTPEVSVKVEIKDGKIVLSSLIDTAGLGGNVSLHVGADYFLDELAKKVPGQIDDAIIAVLKAALKAV